MRSSKNVKHQATLPSQMLSVKAWDLVTFPSQGQSYLLREWNNRARGFRIFLRLFWFPLQLSREIGIEEKMMLSKKKKKKKKEGGKKRKDEVVGWELQSEHLKLPSLEISHGGI